MSYGSIKRFESTGQISLISLTKIAMALDIADELRNIFSQVPLTETGIIRVKKNCWPSVSPPAHLDKIIRCNRRYLRIIKIPHIAGNNIVCSDFFCTFILQAVLKVRKEISVDCIKYLCL